MEPTIAHLYDSLQTVIDKPTTDPCHIPLPPSPSTSSVLQEDCPCQHILGEDITTCLLCQSSIPAIEELLAEKAGYEKEIVELQQQLETEQQRITEQITCIAQLNNRLEQVVSELDDKTAQFKALQSDMELLNDKYVDEIERVAEIQHSKDMVESELEDLSRRLFEEANGMVAHEKREKHNLEIAQKHLENQLKETRDRLGAEQMQLKELRKRMEDMVASDTDMDVPKTPDHIKDLTSLLTEKMHVLNDQHHAIDSMMLDEFQEFVKTGTSVPLKKIHTIPFMKNCQEEDVEACLRFGPNSRLSARKINEAIVLNTCFIEEAPPGFAQEQAKRIMSETPLKISGAKSMMWERFIIEVYLTCIMKLCG
ncbi:GDP/GTP exchange factor Sec2p-domain-containing protein [Gilbertella persicaria]|uniref:GDP/GTP exchange factor Sec2p-domain-containing protein n=1 Tax=Gilbertella persicaria TaxID=101096 RepID=UPI00221E6FEE|nr:GDP/GTP exchange factor Sec2p-domain-containing protein [Gilbertella persicaria]KAI8084356.1 GDP/GTP exchange factor Sec2p-domain-containing protein [Gilbertella persicaria]